MSVLATITLKRNLIRRLSLASADGRGCDNPSRHERVVLVALEESCERDHRRHVKARERT